MMNDAVIPEAKIAASKKPVAKKAAKPAVKKKTAKPRKLKLGTSRKKTGPRTYKRMGKAGDVSMLVTIEVIFPADAIGSDMGEVVDTALESLRTVGAANVTKKELLAMSFNDACTVLDKHGTSR